MYIYIYIYIEREREREREREKHIYIYIYIYIYIFRRARPPIALGDAEADRASICVANALCELAADSISGRDAGLAKGALAPLLTNLAVSDSSEMMRAGAKLLAAMAGGKPKVHIRVNSSYVVYMVVCVWTYICLCHIYIYMYIYICIYICIYFFLIICIHRCIHRYINIYAGSKVLAALTSGKPKVCTT